MTSATIDHKVVSRSEWLRASLEVLHKEKELTRMSDELARERRELPWTRVEKNYEFDGPQGKRNLTDLFGQRSQLAVYHFMFAQDWTEGCPGCCYVTDHLNGAIEHLGARDVSLVLVSRAPLAKLLAFKRRMDWNLPWVSSGGSDFNQDFGVNFTKEQVEKGENSYNLDTRPPYAEENPGLSLFYKDPTGAIFRTYSTYARGLDTLLSTYVILDRAPKGRDEQNPDKPMEWVRRHDSYEPTLKSTSSCCHEKNC